jgi:hypothetical protein
LKSSVEHTEIRVNKLLDLVAQQQDMQRLILSSQQKDADTDGSATAVPGPTYASPAAADGHCSCGVHCGAYSTFPVLRGAV